MILAPKIINSEIRTDLHRKNWWVNFVAGTFKVKKPNFFETKQKKIQWVTIVISLLIIYMEKFQLVEGKFCFVESKFNTEFSVKFTFFSVINLIIFSLKIKLKLSFSFHV